MRGSSACCSTSPTRSCTGQSANSPRRRALHPRQSSGAPRNLGFNRFHDLKLALATARAAFERSAVELTSSQDPRLAALVQVIEAGARTVRDAAALVDPAAFESVVDAVSSAERVLFAGVGTSTPLTQDVAYRFSAIGIAAGAYPEVQRQHLQAVLLSPGDVCVAVRHTGSTRETLAVVQAGRRAGQATAAITSFARSPLTELADHVIVAGTRGCRLASRRWRAGSRISRRSTRCWCLWPSREDARSRAALEAYTEMLGEHRF